MLHYINFHNLQMMLLFNNLITQTILPFNDLTMNLKKGDEIGICFDNVPFANYFLILTNVSKTRFDKIKNNDMLKNGFFYRPYFIEFHKSYKNIDFKDTVMKIDFEVMEDKI